MSRKRKSNTPTAKQQLKEEVAKIKRRIRDIEKRGFYFDDGIDLDIPERATRRTVEAFKKKYSLENIYKQAKYYTEQGEVSGTEARKMERSSSAKRGAATRRFNKKADLQEFDREEWAKDYDYNVTSTPTDASERIVYNVLDIIQEYKPQGMSKSRREQALENQATLEQILQDAIDEYGISALGDRLEQYASEIREIIDEVLYKSYGMKGGNNYVPLVRFANIVKGGMLTSSEVRDMEDEYLSDEYSDEEYMDI